MLGLKWFLRRPHNHRRRATFLIDAQAVLGAIAKGRSSAGAIKRDVKQAAALLLAGDIALACAYVPSEHNPANEPSRGVIRRHRRRASAVPVHLRHGDWKTTARPRPQVRKKGKKTSETAFRDDYGVSIWRFFMHRVLTKLTKCTFAEGGRRILELHGPDLALCYHK